MTPANQISAAAVVLAKHAHNWAGTADGVLSIDCAGVVGMQLPDLDAKLIGFPALVRHLAHTSANTNTPAHLPAV